MKILFVAGVAPIIRDAAAADEMAAKGYRLLSGVKTEPYTPWMRSR